MNAIKEEVPFTSITTYKEASRNLDLHVTNMIRSNRVLPEKWQDNPIVKLAHNLFWAEQESRGRVSAR